MSRPVTLRVLTETPLQKERESPGVFYYQEKDNESNRDIPPLSPLTTSVGRSFLLDPTFVFGCGFFFRSRAYCKNSLK